MSSVVKVLIIGAGQLGSRHLQGALKSSHKLLITIVDPSSDSLKLSKIRANEIELGNSETKIKYMREIPKNKNFNICIISTNANINGGTIIESGCFIGSNVSTKQFITIKKDSFVKAGSVVK